MSIPLGSHARHRTVCNHGHRNPECWHRATKIEHIFYDGSYLLKNQMGYVKKFPREKVIGL